MTANVEETVALFEKRRPNYERFTSKLRELIEDLLDSLGVSYTLEHRTKEVSHFREKITCPGKSYIDPLNEVTDICGVRIILRRISDVDKVVELLRTEFAIDENNSTYKAEELRVDQFGYTPVHLVLQLKSNRAGLTEWQHVAGLKAEVQVRTVLQHAWALISHSFDYKVSADVPRQIRRRLFRLSALFELADTELDQIAEEVDKILQAYKTDVSEGKTAIELNVDSLRAYVDTSPEVQYWIDFLRENIGQKVEGWGDLSRDVRIAERCGIDTLDNVKHIMTDARGWGEDFFKRYYDRFFREHNVTPDKVTTVLNAVVTGLFIASNEDKFPPEVLKTDFGMHDLDSWYIVEAAREAKEAANE